MRLLLQLCNALVAIYIYSLLPGLMLRFIDVAYSLDLLRGKRRTSIFLMRARRYWSAIMSGFVDSIVISANGRQSVCHGLPDLPAAVDQCDFRHMGAIPIAPAKDDPALMEAALKR